MADEAYTPRRSVLYMPGANERALEKAQTLPADALILDLEDAVAPDAKDEARDRVCTAARSGAYGDREVTIRANSLGTRWHADDVAAISGSGADAIVVPKVGARGDVEVVARALEAGGAPDTLAIWAMIETPAGVTSVADIAAHERLAVLVMGTNDLVKELRAEFVPGRAPLLSALSRCVLGARLAGKAILDGVFNDLEDTDGFEAECVQGRQLGFDGKTLIHPKQLGPANRVWAPSEEAVSQAQRVIAAFEEAEAAGRGVVTVDGRMIENLHVEQARRTLAIADAISRRSA
ncbi:MAG: CoA ester lyase [Actinobacteria bacterium]|nr:CoA ester lyase [Actinomycetota bacterium]